MLAAAAEVGAPLGGDFCAISLSDNLKPWATIERRLQAAAEADFVIALYNPASKARPHQLGEAFELLRTIKAAETPVLFVRAAGTAEAKVVTTTLARRRCRRGRHAHAGHRRREHDAPGRALDLHAAQRAAAVVSVQPGDRASAPFTTCPAGLSGRAIMTTGRPSARAASILA